MRHSGFVVPLLAVLLLAASSTAHAGRVQVLNRRIGPNQTLAHALHSIPLPSPQVEALIRALDGSIDFRKVRPGDQLRLVLKDGELDFLDYRKGPTEEWQVRREGDRYLGSQRSIEFETRVAAVEFTIESSLYEAVVGAGEHPNLGVALADVLAWEVDFYMDPRKGDKARVIVEKTLCKGRLVRYGNVLAASYKGQSVGDKRVFRYEPPGGTPSYFAQDGMSARKAFLKSPLQYGTITSRFGNRMHPVLQYMKAHAGVDYGAPIGTPVWAVADGTVTKAGYEGAAGNLLCVRHANGFESCYMHLSKFGAGVRVGARVHQKQIVAYSGNTGRSTGPHLHYGLKRGGAWVNPLNQNFPRSEPLPKEHLPDFTEKIAHLVPQLDGVAVADAATTQAP